MLYICKHNPKPLEGSRVSLYIKMLVELKNMFHKHFKHEMFRTFWTFHSCKMGNNQLFVNHILNMKSYIDQPEMIVFNYE